MKKNKTHKFAHPDPEKIVLETKSKATEKGAPTPRADNVAPFVYRDLKRTAITITVFVILLFALYLVQIKTGLLRPVLRLFGL